MASFDRIQDGQVLYTVTRQRAGNTTLTRTAVHPVRVLSVDRDKRRVTASWNGNAARIYTESQVSKWKVAKPTPKWGSSVATP